MPTEIYLVQKQRNIAPTKICASTIYINIFYVVCYF